MTYLYLVRTHNLKTSILKGFKYLKSCHTRRNLATDNKIGEKLVKSDVAINIPKGSNVTKEIKSNKLLGADKVKKPFVSDVKRLFGLAGPEKWNLTGAVGLLLISSTVTMAVPFSLGKILDIIYSNSGEQKNTQDNLNKVCGVLVGVFLLGAICNAGRVYIMSAAGYRMTQRLRKTVFQSIVRQEQGFFDKRSTGELINRLSADTQLVGQALSTNISDGLRNLVMVFAGSGMMFYMSPQLALVGLGIVPPIAGMAIIYGRYVRKISKRVQDSLADATRVAEEKISNMRTVRVFGKESHEVDNYDERVRSILDMGYLESKARAIFYGFAGLSGNLIIICVLYYGGVMISSQSLTVGNLSSFLMYAAYIGVSIGGLSSFYSELNKSIGAATRLWELCDRVPAIPSSGGLIPPKRPEGHIVFKDVEFSYPSRSDSKVLNKLNLEIKPGSTVAVVGPSGSGKSTIMSLLLRLYDPDNGEIYLDGHKVQSLDPNWIRKNIGTVAQEPVLFSTSIRENILYGADDHDAVDEEHFMNVCKETNVLEFVKALPDGFNTMVGERGVMLSGGQKQRVAIARALMKNPKILLLDEATSALDAQSERYVQEALEKVTQNRTVLTIAHRLSTIQNANIIMVLQNGVIVETGSYAELVNKPNGCFRELVKHQTFKETT